MVFGVGSKNTVDLEVLGLPEEDRVWLEGEVGPNPTLGQIDQLAQSPKLSKEAAGILVGLKLTLSGDLRPEDGRAYTADGARRLSDIPSRTFAAARRIGAKKPEPVQDLEDQLRPVMIGQDQALAPFTKFLKDTKSPSRQIPAVISVATPDGHGLDQTVDAYARSVYGDDARVYHVDLSEVSDKDFAPLFNGDGALSDKTLKLINEANRAALAPKPEPKEGDGSVDDTQSDEGEEKEPQEEKKQPGVIHVAGIDKLREKRPRLAKTLSEILVRKKQQGGFPDVGFLLDFEPQAGTTPQKQTVEALGAVGNRALSSHAVFNELNDDAIRQYIDHVLPGLLADEAPGVTITFDRTAHDTLVKALTTPFAPLEELEPRLLKFVMTHFQDAVDLSSDSEVRVSLSSKFSANPKALDDLLEELHTEFPDLEMGEELFTLHEVGTVREFELEPRTLLANAELLRDRFARLATSLTLGVPSTDPVATETVAALISDLQQANLTFERVLGEAEQNDRYGMVELINGSQRKELDSILGRVRLSGDAVWKLGTREREQILPADWAREVSVAIDRWEEAGRLIVAGLSGEESRYKPKPEPVEAAEDG